jgi:hypothetical protein
MAIRAPGTPAAEEKLCATCGRRIEPRAKWARVWPEVRYCSRRCRDQRPSAVDAQLEKTIVDLLEARTAQASICPSEAARRVQPDAWRPLLERARQAGRRLAARGVVSFTQGGAFVDPSRARGPVRLKRGRMWAER